MEHSLIHFSLHFFAEQHSSLLIIFLLLFVACQIFKPKLAFGMSMCIAFHVSPHPPSQLQHQSKALRFATWNHGICCGAIKIILNHEPIHSYFKFILHWLSTFSKIPTKLPTAHHKITRGRMVILFVRTEMRSISSRQMMPFWKIQPQQTEPKRLEPTPQQKDGCQAVVEFVKTHWTEMVTNRKLSCTFISLS